MVCNKQQRRRSAVRAAGQVALLVSLVSGLTVAIGTAPALADVIPQTGPSGALAIAQAIAAPSATITGASFVAAPGGTPNGTSTTPLAEFPTDGSSFGILTTGNVKSVPNTATLANTDLHGGNIRGNTDFDVTVLKADLTVQPGANCLTFDFKFLSEEYPGFVNTGYNDAFVAELDTSTWTTSGSTITAPDDFAFDSSHQAVSINSTGLGSMSAANGAGTAFNGTQSYNANFFAPPGNAGGATGLLHASTQVTPGPHSVYFSIFDQGDHRLDSATFLDNLTVGFVPSPSVNCVPGATLVNFKLSVSPASATNPVGTTHTVTARLTDTKGNSIPSAPVDFTVTGPNSTSGSGTTDPSGDATFTYTGTALGSDMISACYEPSGPPCAAVASATKTWVKASPTISTAAANPVPAGGIASDSATLAGGSNPGGSVSFQLFAPGDTTCQTPIASQDATLAGGIASSGNVGVGGPGTYNWVATYGGDPNNSPVSSGCGAEPFIVAKYSPSITTTASGSVPAGGTVSDTATVSGGLNPGGSVTFQLFAPDDPTCRTPTATTTGTLATGTASSGNAPAGGVGTYNWVATYNGDATNNAVTSPCGSETVAVTRATPSISTTPSGSVPAGGKVSDAATLRGGFSPAGSVVFTLYAPGDPTCKTPIATKTGSVGGGSASSGDVTVGAAGTYNWVAAYGGDASNESLTSPCGSEPVIVTGQRMTGRAYGLSATVTSVLGELVKVSPTPDTGSISTTSSSSTSTPCVAKLGDLLSAKILCANVTTEGFPGKSTASASLAEATVGTPDRSCTKSDPDKTGDLHGKGEFYGSASAGKGHSCVESDPYEQKSLSYVMSDYMTSESDVARDSYVTRDSYLKSHSYDDDEKGQDEDRESESDDERPASPTITVRAVKSTSTTRCDGSTGTTTIDYLAVGNNVVISTPTQVAPNTTITVGLVKLVLNEQIPFSTPDRGLTVNAVHATLDVLGLAKVDVIVASSESDIGNCP
jgi:hypothetical protein